MTAPKFPKVLPSALQTFVQGEASGGIVLMAAALLAMIVANLGLTASGYTALLGMTAGPVLNAHLGPMTPLLWINDGLMAVFFLLVGLEIKREVVGGELASADRRRLPVIAATAGMAVPALVFLFVTDATPALARGWAIPAATDIAFAVGVLAILGRRIPSSLTLFLTTVAIVDDMGAVAIIALAYTDHIALAALAGAAVAAALLYVLNRRGERRLAPYLIGFATLWLLVLVSGIHATIAGVVTALLIPIDTDEGASPLHRLEHALHPWVAFAIVPLFGFANAGVNLNGVRLEVLAEPLVLGIAAGLFLGKQAGIFGAAWLADRIGLAPRPAGASWWQVYGVALIAGIGFTMSLFIGGLAFPGDPALVERVKLGVIAGSLLSAVAGYAVLRVAGRAE